MKGLALLLSPKKPAAEGPPEESGEGYMEDLKLMAGDLISAIKKGDASAVAEAFASMHETCASSGDKE